MAKKKKNIWAKVGVWSYVIGLIIAVIMGILAQFNAGGMQPWIIGILAILGVIVGLLNIGDEKVSTFLLASIAFVVTSIGLGGVFKTLGPAFNGLTVFMSAIVIFTTFGAVVVAFKALYHIAKDN